jgi:hypothetical protein
VGVDPCGFFGFGGRWVREEAGGGGGVRTHGVSVPKGRE